MRPDEIPRGPPLDSMACAAGVSAEECVRQGATWTLLRVLDPRRILSIAVVMSFGTHLGSARSLMETATEERVRALGDAIDRNDAASAMRVLEAWWPHERDQHARVVDGLLGAFGHLPPK